MLRSTLLVLALALATAVAAAAATTAEPGRTLAVRAPVLDLAQTGRAVAYVVASRSGDCTHVGLWRTTGRSSVRFGRRAPCGDATSTGSGIADVAVARTRVVWVAYAGGNTRDWTLLTATPSRREPRRLRFVSRDVDAPAPIVLGDGDANGIPYAVDDEVTLLGDDGSPRFRWQAPDAVRALAAGRGPGGWRVAALLANGDVVLLSASGTPLATVPLGGSGPVGTIRLAPAGLLAQVAGAVQLRTPSSFRVVALPVGGQFLDHAEGRLVVRVGRELQVVRVRDGASSLLLRGARTTPVALDAAGVVWANGNRLSWACRRCVTALR